MKKYIAKVNYWPSKNELKIHRLARRKNVKSE